MPRPPRADEAVAYRFLQGSDGLNKVFGIGLSRTGTRSLAAALNLLEIKTVWYPHDRRTFAELAEGNYGLSVLKTHDGATDTPIAAAYPQLDSKFPGSKFVLTVRNREDWLRSCARHWARLPTSMPLPTDAAYWQQFVVFINTAVYGCVGFNSERFSYVYDRHVENALNYFRDREDDLLLLDIASGEGWDKRCAFLDRPILDVPFPNVNTFPGDEV